MTQTERDGFQRVWLRGGATERVEASVGLYGKLGKAEPSVEAAKGGHVYVIRLAARSLTTVAGGSTDVLYVGQGDEGRVLQLWRGQHSACKRLAWAGWAQPSQPLGVVVEVQPAEDPELREVELLNAFLWEHGQMPALNSRHEGWLPSRVLRAVARGLAPCGVVTASRPYDGPRHLAENRARTYTAVDLYGAPPAEKAWHWRGSLLWLRPAAWLDPVARSGLAEPFVAGSFALIACPSKEETPGWHEIPRPLTGALGWIQGATPPRVRLLHAGAEALGHPQFGRLPELPALVRELIEACASALPAQGVTG